MTKSYKITLSITATDEQHVKQVESGNIRRMIGDFLQESGYDNISMRILDADLPIGTEDSAYSY